jgi:hypothetical protein
MEIKVCPKCGSENLTLESRGKLPIMEAPQVALRCADCGGWIKWCPKEERALYLGKNLYLETEKREVTKECQDKFINFSVTWAMNNISKTIDMHLLPRIKEAKDQEDIRYCEGMLDAVGDLLEDNFYMEIQKRIYAKRAKLGTR